VKNSNLYNITIEKIVHEGLGLSRLPDGKIIFVPYSLPGEKLEVFIKQDKKDFAFGRINSVLEKSDKRIEPVCPVFEKCGGCSFLHTGYETELEIKKSVLDDILKRNEIVYPEYNVIESPDRFHYRNNAQIKVTMDGELGFYQQNSLKIIPFRDRNCFLLTGNILDHLKNIDQDTLLFTKGFRIREGREIYTKGIPGEKYTKTIEYIVNKNIYELDIDGFFQVNSLTNPLFLDEVSLLVNEQVRHFLELYSGIGFFSIPLSKNKNIQNYTGVELSNTAVRHAKNNNKHNNTQVDFIAGDAEAYFEKAQDVDALLVDPPRQGLGLSLVEKIIRKKPEHIFYISCNPATYARDVRKLQEHGYSIKKISIIDNFPGTYHFELISHISCV